MRTGHSRLYTVPAAALALLLAAPPEAAAAERFTEQGVEVWLSSGTAGEVATVRLVYDAGLATESADSRGRSAALAAWLLRGPSPHLAPGDLEERAARAGLRVETSLEQRTVALSISGPVSSLERALWLATERLRAPPASRKLADTVRGALWSGAEHTRAEAVGPAGDPHDVLTQALLGADGGHTAFASRLRAQRAEDEVLLDMALEALARAPARLLVVVPSGHAGRARALVERDLSGIPDRTAPSAEPFTLSSEARRDVPESMHLDNRRDGRRSVVVGWDLRGAARAAELDVLERDAGLLALRTWLQHEGGPLHRQLVDQHAVARDVRVELRDDGRPLLLASVDVRSAETAEATRLLVEEVQRAAEDGPSPEALRGAARVTAVELASEWAWAPGRARLLEVLVSSGRLPEGRDPGAWLGSLRDALADLRPDTLRALASWGLTADRRVVARVEPTSPPPSERFELDADLLSTYLRIMVDVRCPPPGAAMDVVDLLERKYELDARTYVALTRAIARRPDLMRQLAQQADDRCREYRKLRGLMSTERALALHEALACGPGREADEERRERALRRIWERFDIDPSWYPPLVRMLREDVTVRERVQAIDERCAPRFGPAARLMEDS
ncbi:MAG: hypothetical protein ACQEXJ_09115 [Myxococcota bacterium]